MNSTVKIVLGLVTVVIIVAAVFAYMSFANSSSPNPTPSPTATPSETPSSTATPTSTVIPTSTPSSAPTETPTEATTSTPTLTSGTTPTPDTTTSTPVFTSTPTPIPTPLAIPTPTPAPTPTPVPTVTPFPYVTPSASLTLNGAGATFPQPFLNSTIVAYTSQVITRNLQINYQGVGSGAGVSSLTSKTVDFACSDAPLTDSQRTAAPNSVHIPESIGAITVAYNIPGVATGLKMTGIVLANIFLGSITNWNDQAIAALNPGVNLPNHAITTVHRSDSSGTTNWFTRYLTIVSPAWNSTVGYGTSVQWPGTNSLGASGNSAVAATVNQTQYSVGYVELAYALQNAIPVCAMQNAAGNYIMPSLESTTAAAASLPTSGLPSGSDSWMNVVLLNTPGAQAYPIVTPTYVLVYKELNVIQGMTLERATQIVQYIWYVIHDGQALAAPLQYASLPSNLVQIDETTLRSITFNGQTLIH